MKNCYEVNYNPNKNEDKEYDDENMAEDEGWENMDEEEREGWQDIIDYFNKDF